MDLLLACWDQWLSQMGSGSGITAAQTNKQTILTALGEEPLSQQTHSLAHLPKYMRRTYLGCGKSPRRRWVSPLSLLVFKTGTAGGERSTKADFTRSFNWKAPVSKHDRVTASICPAMVPSNTCEKNKNFHSFCPFFERRGTERRFHRRTHSTVCSFHRRAMGEDMSPARFSRWSDFND